MIFLIHYKRSSGEIVKLDEFSDQRRREAEEARLSLELSLLDHKNGDEVCLLDAANLTALKMTHRRYFESLRTLTASGSVTVASTKD